MLFKFTVLPNQKWHQHKKPDIQITKFMGPNWGPPGSCRPQWAPCWPHEPCYQGNPHAKAGPSLYCMLLITENVETFFLPYSVHGYLSLRKPRSRFPNRALIFKALRLFSIKSLISLRAWSYRHGRLTFMFSHRQFSFQPFLMSSQSLGQWEKTLHVLGLSLAAISPFLTCKVSCRLGSGPRDPRKYI